METGKRHGAIALLEFRSVAAGILASDYMVKRSPIALLRCGTIHPGRYLILVGGSVASTEEAFAAGLQVGKSRGALGGSIFLGDVHPYVHDAVLGERKPVVGDALAVVETRSSPALLGAVDAAVKSTPVVLSEIRLGDDLGGHAIALMSGALFDTETALDICGERAGEVVETIRAGACSLDAVRSTCKASASCGSCTGLVESLLALTLGGEVQSGPKTLCKCTSFTHDDVRRNIVDKGLKAIPQVMQELPDPVPTYGTDTVLRLPSAGGDDEEYLRNTGKGIMQALFDADRLSGTDRDEFLIDYFKQVEARGRL